LDAHPLGSTTRRTAVIDTEIAGREIMSTLGVRAVEPDRSGGLRERR
jgi:hypothetical protein